MLCSWLLLLIVVMILRALFYHRIRQMSSGVQVVHLFQIHLNFLHASAIGFPLLSSAFGLLSSAFTLVPTYYCLRRFFLFP